MKLAHRIHRTLSPILYGEGLSVVPRGIGASWPQRRYLRQLLRTLDVDCVLDVGANAGIYGTELRLIGYDGLIFSFEPDPAVLPALRARASRDAKWHVFDYALGSKAGEAVFNVMNVSLFNSFRAPSTTETAMHADANTIKHQIVVPIRTLNELLPELIMRHGLNRPFLKMDTQGYDLEVFRGASQLYKLIQGLQSEVALRRIYEDSASWMDSIREYESAGFDLDALFKVNAESRGLIEMDCYMLRGW